MIIFTIIFCPVFPSTTKHSMIFPLQCVFKYLVRLLSLYWLHFFKLSPLPVLIRCSNFWVPGWPGLLPCSFSPETRASWGEARQTGKSSGREGWRTIFHWTNLEPVLRVLRPGAATTTGYSRPSFLVRSVEPRNRRKSHWVFGLKYFSF